MLVRLPQQFLTEAALVEIQRSVGIAWLDFVKTLTDFEEEWKIWGLLNRTSMFEGCNLILQQIRS